MTSSAHLRCHAAAIACCWLLLILPGGHVLLLRGPVPRSKASSTGSAVQTRNHTATLVDALDFAHHHRLLLLHILLNSEPRYRAPVPEGFECSLRCHGLVRVKRPASPICIEAAGQPGSAAESQTD
ncbi:hypothetical protein LX36DRAFT_99603 [Colletotrichum falcatum]|nr:hypothetical protein LX36DRAFT_99603 [Colletotrichum falcatum]